MRKLEALFELAIQTRRMFPAISHSNSIQAEYYLAELYRNLARYTKAEFLFNQGLNSRRQSVPDGDAETAFILNGLGDMYCDLGRSQKQSLGSERR